MVTIESIEPREAHDLAWDQGDGAVAAVLFGGDRLSCCTVALGLYEDGVLAGVATLAPGGEQGDGVPTVVGCYVRRDRRRRGHGSRLLRQALLELHGVTGGQAIRLCCVTASGLATARAAVRDPGTLRVEVLDHTGGGLLEF